MPVQPIAGPGNRPVTVEVFEPPQSQDQSEVLLDTFDLAQGEVRDYEFRSATAGYRFVDLTDPARRADMERRHRELQTKDYPKGFEPSRSSPTPAQAPPPGVAPVTTVQDELDAGRQRQQELEKAYGKEHKGKRAERAREDAREQVSGGTVASATAPAELDEADHVKAPRAAIHDHKAGSDTRPRKSDKGWPKSSTKDARKKG